MQGSNKIEDKGCSMMSQIIPRDEIWTKIFSLSLSKVIRYRGNAKIGEKGCMYLSKVNFPALNYLSLCMYCVVQLATTSETVAAGI
jgi:hypothetical protein